VRASPPSLPIRIMPQTLSTTEIAIITVSLLAFLVIARIVLNLLKKTDLRAERLRQADMQDMSYRSRKGL